MGICVSPKLDGNVADASLRAYLVALYGDGDIRVRRGGLSMEDITLHGSIPQIQSAIKFGGDGSARVQFDVPASELPELLKLMAYAPGKLLEICVKVEG